MMGLSWRALAAFAACGAACEALAAPVAGHFVHIRIEKTPAILSVAEVEVMSGGVNVAKGRPVYQSSTGYGGVPERAVDGNTSCIWEEDSITHTDEGRKDKPQWWEVRLAGDLPIDAINIYNRKGFVHRLNNAEVLLLDSDRRVVWGQSLPEVKELKTALVVSGETGGEFRGEQIDSATEPPAGVAEIQAAYTKADTWTATAAATAAKLGRYDSLSPIFERLLADFPDDADAIMEHLNTPAFSRGALRKGPPNIQSAVGNEAAERSRAALRWFNPDGLAKAIRAYAQKHPEVYGDGSALLRELESVKEALNAAKDNAEKMKAAEALCKLMDAVYLRHPGVDFEEILFVKRLRSSPMGLPQNWQGNSSVPLQGYINSIVRAPIRSVMAAKDRTVVASSAFLGDVDLDYDADKIAYSAGVPGKPAWRVMETRLDKPMERVQKTPQDIDDIDCYDPCYLPDGRMLFVATSGFHGVPCVGGSDYVGNTHLLEKDGSVKRLVFDQDNSWCPVVMNNGRVMYLRWEYTDSAHYFSRVLMTMNMDGSDQKAFYGSNSYWPNSLFYARPLPGSSTKFCGIVSGHHGLARQGELVLFDVMKGRSETGGVMQRIPSQGRPVDNKVRDGLVNGSHPLFLHPYPLTDELFLVSVHQNSGDPFVIALADVYDNIIPLRCSDRFHLLEPMPLAKRQRPLMSVDQRKDDRDTCLVYLQGAHLGEGLKGVPPRKVRKLRLFAYSYSPRNFGGHYEIGFEGPWDARNIIGEVDLEEDGSALFTVPANTPIAIQPLDGEGCKLQEMRSWFVGVPGETISCVGCHENQNEAPGAPGYTRAAGKRPLAPKPWYGPRRNYAFEREVQPVLDRKCLGCHSGATERKTRMGEKIPSFEGSRSPIGHYSKAYVNLMPYVRRNGPEGDYHLLTPLEFHVSTSELYQRLQKGHHGVKLTAEEWDRLITWMDLNVPYWGTWGECTEKNQRHQKMLERRAEMARKWAGDTFDPEAVVNPYVPGTEKFVPPEQPPEPAAAPVPPVAGWPFDAEKARKMQEGHAPRTIELGAGEKLELAYIPAGSFVMGANDLTPAERPVAAVKIEKGFWMAVTEITQGQMRLMDPAFDNGVYDKHYKDQVNRGYYLGDQDPDFAVPGHTNFPAIRVSWNQAQSYCRWLSDKIGRRVRLPTEAEWEWACRAGTSTEMNYGTIDDDFSAHENMADHMFIEFAVNGIDPKPIARGDDPNPKNRPPAIWDYELRDRRYNDHVLMLAKVGSYAPNAWGLRDMHGNAAEWTASEWRPYPYVESDGRNGAKAASDDVLRVVRGGSWYRRPMVSGSAWRWRYPAWMRPFDVGFRVVVED